MFVYWFFSSLDYSSESGKFGTKQKFPHNSSAQPPSQWLGSTITNKSEVVGSKK
jgi:hypothetical protein